MSELAKRLILRLMARNYIEFWSSKINLGGNFGNSVIAGTLEDCETQTEQVLINFPTAFVVWQNQPGYFLYNKSNLIGLLKTTAVHYGSFFAANWIFFQDGFRALESPREEWSNGK